MPPKKKIDTINISNPRRGIDEAIEERQIIDDENKTPSESSGEDLMENMEKDYKPIPELDAYEEEDIDKEEFSAMEESERRKVDEFLTRRDKSNFIKGNRIPAALLHDLEEYSDEEALRKKIRTHKKIFSKYDEDDQGEAKEAEDFIDRQDPKGKISDWLKEPQVIRYIQVRFASFIKHYKEDEKPIYEDRIINMCTNNKQSLEVNYPHLAVFNQHLASWIVLYPQLTVPILNEVAFELTCQIFPQYPDIYSEIIVRIKDLPVMDKLRDLRYYHLNNLVKVRGVVTKRTNVYPQLKKIFLFCEKCGEKMGPYYFNGSDDLNTGTCPLCQSKAGFKIDVDETVYRNYQKITVQESPGSVPPGRIPRYKEVILTNDLVDSIRPGDEVEISGIYISRFDLSANIKHSFPIFSTYLEANYIKGVNELEVNELTDDDKLEIRKLAKDPNIANKIFNSIAPSIFGHEFIKKALAIALFGGMPKDVNNKHRIRGDINVLVLGDPGLAKSQFLKYIQKVFHRSVYTTGKGASAVGLTAGVHKDPVTKEWTLEGGALVLADKGICLIDEFDKMNDQDRTSIHEAMEQQSISISKAGIVTTLSARCSVIAAANPLKGRYDNSYSFNDNVDLTEPILSRFDILCVVKDEIDLLVDNALATFVINSHIMSHPDDFNKEENLLKVGDSDLNTGLSSLNINSSSVKSNEIPQDILSKYIMYARKYVQPKLSDLNKQKVSKFYSDLRIENEKTGGLTIAVRHLESLIRIAEAHAKIHLREFVRADDIDFSIKMILESFLMSQKNSISKTLRKKFKHHLTMQEDHLQLLMNILNRCVKESIHFNTYFKEMSGIPSEVVVKQDRFEREAQDYGIYSFGEFYESGLFKKSHKLEDRSIICDTTI